MTATLPVDGADPEEIIGTAREPLASRLRRPAVLASLAVLGLVVLAGLLAPVLAPDNPGYASLGAILAPPSLHHLLGADSSGRDVLSRLLYGARASLSAGLIATAVAVAIGVPAGLLAGYLRGWADVLASWMADLLLALPVIVVLIAAVAVAGPGLVTTMATLGVLLAPGFFRLVRGSALAIREEPFVDAARVSGLTGRRIVARHVLPAVRTPIVVQAALVFGIALMIEAGIDFLGLGQPGAATWGNMLQDAFNNIGADPWLVVPPAGAIVLTVLPLTVLANALRHRRAAGPGRAGRAGRRGAAGSRRAAGSRGAAGWQRGDPAGPRGGGPLLEVTGLRIAYPGADGERTVVDSVSLAIGRGEVLGLVGESGCGKTQVVLAVLGLLPDGGRLAAGQVRFAGQRIDALRAAGLNQVRGRRIGYVSQEPMSNLDPSFTIGSQLIEPIRVHLGLRRSQARDRAAGLLARVGIADPDGMLASYPHQISGGMAQRALIAGAISCDPDLLIADEPTTALDVTVQAEVLDLLWSLQRERSMAVLIVSHDLGVVADLCDRVAVMYAGEIVEQAEVGALFARPAHPYTRGLIAAGARRSGWREPLAAIPGAVPARIDPAGGCRFAPRCSYATAACAVHPPLRPLGRDLVRCVNADQWAQR